MARVKYPHLVLKIGYDQPSGRDWYCHIRGWLDREDNRLFYSSDEGGVFQGIFFNAQSDNESLVRRSEPMYGYRPEFKGQDKGLSELERGVKALRMIDKTLDKIYEQSGPPASFGAWVQRLATALGIDKVQLPDRSYPISPSDAARAIDRQIEEWVDRAKGARGDRITQIALA